MTCPKCQNAMEEGHIPDQTYGGNVLLGWFPGPPEKSFWRGTKVDEKQRVPIVANRCVACGFIELYAPPT